MQKFISFYFLVMSCYELTEEVKEAYSNSKDSLAPDWIEMHRYTMMKAAVFLGNMIFMSFVQEAIFEYPNVPTVIQFGFFVFWFLNFMYRVVENFFLTFLIMMLAGGLKGASYTNFLILANAKVDR